MKQAFILIIIAISLTGCGLIQQQRAAEAQRQATEARQQYIAGLRQAAMETKAATADCKEKLDRKELKTHVAATQCFTPKMIEAYQRAGYRYMDLLEVFATKLEEIAEREDNKKLTKAQAKREMAEAYSTWANEERQRNLQTLNAQNQAIAAQNQAIAAEAQQRAANAAMWQAIKPAPSTTSTTTNCMQYGSGISCRSNSW